MCMNIVPCKRYETVHVYEYSSMYPNWDVHHMRLSHIVYMTFLYVRMNIIPSAATTSTAAAHTLCKASAASSSEVTTIRQPPVAVARACLEIDLNIWICVIYPFCIDRHINTCTHLICVYVYHAHYSTMHQTPV